MGYMSENDKERSSMRYNHRVATVCVAGLLAIVGAYILIMAWKHGGVNDWLGLAAFVAGLLAGLTGVSWTKAVQKKFETP